MERGLSFDGSRDLRRVSNSEHEAKQYTEDAANEQAIKNVAEEIPDDEPHYGT